MTDTKHATDTPDRPDLITPAKLRAWGACWTDENIARYFGGREAITAREISGDETIRHRDRMWVLTHALARKDIWLTYDFALWCAEQALKKLTPDWQAKMEPVFVQVRGLRDQPAAAAATEKVAWGAYTAAYTAACAAACAADATTTVAGDAAACAAAAATDAARAARSAASSVACSAANAACAACAAAAEATAGLGHALAMLEN